MWVPINCLLFLKQNKKENVIESHRQHEMKQKISSYSFILIDKTYLLDRQEPSVKFCKINYERNQI